MTTLTVSATTDYSLTDLSGTDAITFTNGGAESLVTAAFAASQFAVSNVDGSFQIDFDCHFTGSNGANVVVVNLSTTDLSFNASAWNLSNWDTLNGDRIEINGTASSENIVGSFFVADTVNGRGGDDVIFSLGDGDRLHGGSGGDRITIVGSSPSVIGSPADAANIVTGDGARDVLLFIHSSGSDETFDFDGGNARDTFNMRERTDDAVTIDIGDGGGGRFINGYVSLTSIEKLNLILGDSADTVTGGSFADLILGRGGGDVLSGGGDADTLNGGLGADTLTGGGGADLFVYRSSLESGPDALADHITDFTQGEDLISLAAIDAVPGGADDEFTFIGSNTFSHTAGELQVVAGATETIISADIDGDAGADLVIVLDTVVALTDLDFLR